MIVLSAGSLLLAGCNSEKKNTETTTTDTAITTDNASATDTDYEAEYRSRATRMSQRMATDLKFDTATEARVQQVYYDRERRLDEVRRKYNNQEQDTLNSGGVAAADDNATMNTGMLQEMETIDVEINNELRDILKPEQYKMYEVKRSEYFNTAEATEDVDREITRDGDEITVKTGNIKVKAEPGKSKVETDTYESKIKGDERKFKSKTSDTKIKSEPGKTKYESGDTKIKVKE
ncbi:MAG: hypothetical protein JWQ14_2967 [Adhaeribacter sp.]|nr:hypothetical protein [Adhaeribacter sp.]